MQRRLGGYSLNNTIVIEQLRARWAEKPDWARKGLLRGLLGLASPTMHALPQKGTRQVLQHQLCCLPGSRPQSSGSTYCLPDSWALCGTSNRDH